MGRARGANALLVGKIESSYGVAPAETEWNQLPFVSSALSGENALIEDDSLGQGREPFDPILGPHNATGDLTVPVDVRSFGFWLKLFFGAPTTTASGYASGGWTFSDQPSTGSTITVNGVTFTFRSSGASGDEVNIGADLEATMTAVAAALNASADPDVAEATYAGTATGVTVTHDTAGLAGNDFTLAASATSNATVTGATLTGGTMSHVFTSGSYALPSAALEVAHPELAKPYHPHLGVMANTLRISHQRSGLLNAVLGMVAQQETDPSASSLATSPTQRALQRFVQARGEVQLAGETLANVVSAEFSYSNNLDVLEDVRPDGLIGGADPGMAMAGGNLVMRFADHVLFDAATAGEPVSVTRRWTKGANSLAIATPRLFLPRFKRPTEGPRGLQFTANVLAAKPSSEAMVTATLINDVASY
ncbi:phage tail tube protein [Stakelama tenebrarum]|uniref:Uncharacterized protein n=1 Tax=Stakelama tenebrarum TaxID=2711215 RepID=A0A6G6Y515_9SPHN|nr:phage tail tube protein [Sphingosinithalassobacter tenebrarum]QIG79989.1 hypothetical protein G5C33_09510 [Sphingosinithalassobacter tenebrarum]